MSRIEIKLTLIIGAVTALAIIFLAALDGLSIGIFFFVLSLGGAASALASASIQLAEGPNFEWMQAYSQSLEERGARAKIETRRRKLPKRTRLARLEKEHRVLTRRIRRATMQGDLGAMERLTLKLHRLDARIKREGGERSNAASRSDTPEPH